MSDELLAAIITIGTLVSMFLWSIFCDRRCSQQQRSGWKPSPALSTSRLHVKRNRFSEP